MKDTSNDEVYEPSCSLGISVNDEVRQKSQVFDDNEGKEEEEMLMKMSEEEEIENEIEEILMGKDNDIEQREAENSEGYHAIRDFGTRQLNYLHSKKRSLNH
ncbi:uncharacterized protein LOC112460500 [Temnothorax curvispinosus]|uniref:Uncharacterized protein LOC112460500 n=1 Tax=Temnothorax curvispinosus TaxID=300111 RepID=A0A6J1QF51_9HYME|nr:uncharacterized protein LOC112460500 [Temnothorax curvispinosus]